MDQPQHHKSNRYPSVRHNTRVSAKGLAVIRILCAILMAANLWLIYRISFSSQGIVNFRQHREQVYDLKNKIWNLQAENQELFSRIQDFKTDAKFQERIVREQLGWARDNELIIEFPPPQKGPP